MMDFSRLAARWTRPSGEIGEADVQRGLRALVYDGMCSQVMGVLTGGAFLVQFALLLGASNFVIGLLAAVGPLTQILQIPAIYVIEATRLRKATTILAAGVGRICLVVAAIVPWVVPPSWRIPVFLVSLFLYYGLGAVAGCAWNSWMRDFVPQSTMGSYFAKRLAIATAVGAIMTVVAGAFIDRCTSCGQNPTNAYSFVFLAGIGAGIVGLLFLGRTPEPRMLPRDQSGLSALLAEPFRDVNFRKLLIFLGLWSFAVNFAAPFFTVYLLKRLGLSMTWVTGLAVLSQAVNVLCFRLWGRLCDRYSNKPILSFSGTLFVISIGIWPFTTMPDVYALTIPLVILIHVLAGISTAGVAISGGNIALKLAPMGRATAYLAVNGLVCGTMATLSPVLAGLSADWFERQQLELAFTWVSGASRFHLPAVQLEGLDFLFVVALVLGLYSLHRLLAVRELGEVDEALVVTELMAGMRQKIKHVSTVAGLRYLTFFPYNRLKDAVRPAVKPSAPAAAAPPQ